ncbi:MAG: NUDIX hydrolase [Caldisphaera sp.]|jgi:ADP-ribose pyrophosphatase YjhB (NUDIX family)|uniref:NUDIX hydrolase n=1 Tax=Caldisphaera sp. TaxID=2060322 RepID=UPI003D13AD31
MKKCIVSGGILIEKDKVLLIYHEKLNKWLYPGGHVEPNETPREAAIREFKEETGLNVEVIGEKNNLSSEDAIEEPKPIAIMYETVKYPNETHMHYDLIFLVKFIDGELKNGRWFDKNEIDSIDTYENVKKILKFAFKFQNV